MATYQVTGAFKTPSGLSSGVRLGSVEIDDKKFPRGGSRVEERRLALAKALLPAEIAGQYGELISVNFNRQGPIGGNSSNGSAYANDGADAVRKASGSMGWNTLFTPIWAFPFKLIWRLGFVVIVWGTIKWVFKLFFGGFMRR